MPLEAEGGGFNPRLSHAATIVGPVLQMQHPCPADPQACPAFSQQIYHPVVGKDLLSYFSWIFIQGQYCLTIAFVIDYSLCKNFHWDAIVQM